jgi:DNA-binding MarR family transcriptional regulator
MDSALQQELDPLELDRIPVGTSRVPMAAYRLSRLLRSALSDVLSHGSELGLVAWRICLALSQKDELSQKELVEFTDMEQGQVSRAMRLMEERGLIRSTQSLKDRRVRLFRLDDKGWDHFERARPAVTSFYHALDQVLSPDEREQFLDMSRRIAHAATAVARVPDGADGAATSPRLNRAGKTATRAHETPGN